MDALEQAVEQGRVPMEMIDAAVARILHYKREYAGPSRLWMRKFSVPAAALPKICLKRQSMRKSRLSWAETRASSVRVRRRFRRCPTRAERSALPREMQKHFGGSCVELPLKPDAQAAAEAVEAAKGASLVVVGTLNATVYKGQMDILEELEKLGVPVAVRHIPKSV